MSKRAVLCYLPPPSEQTHKFLAAYPGSTLTTIFFSDTPDHQGLKIPELQHVKIQAPNYSDSYGLQAFLWAIRFAKKLQLDEFLYIETDCGFACSKWDEEAWHAWDNWHEPYVLGTPVVLGNWDQRDWQESFINYAKRYQDSIDLPIHISTFPTQFTAELHPNGALAIYNTRLVEDVFKDLLYNPAAKLTQSATYDLAVGLYMRQKFGVRVFKHFAFCNTLFSECGNALCSEGEREDWLAEMQFTAVHKYTYK